MYGMVNKAIEQMITGLHGEDIWVIIREQAGVKEKSFISSEAYPDHVTYNLVLSASRILSVPISDLMEEFGQYWVLNTALSGYPTIMSHTGKTLPQFLQNLNNMHIEVGKHFPKLRPPRFECTEITEKSLHLHHYTDRPGLAHFVIGLVRGLGKHLNMPATVAHIALREQGADHDVFEVCW